MIRASWQFVLANGRPYYRTIDNYGEAQQIARRLNWFAGEPFALVVDRPHSDRPSPAPAEPFALLVPSDAPPPAAGDEET